MSSQFTQAQLFPKTNNAPKAQLSQIASITLDKSQYSLGEMVTLTVLSPDIDSSLLITHAGQSYSYLGVIDAPLKFEPKSAGTYSVFLYDSTNALQKTIEFEVLGKSSSPQSQINSIISSTQNKLVEKSPSENYGSSKSLQITSPNQNAPSESIKEISKKQPSILTDKPSYKLGEKVSISLANVNEETQIDINDGKSTYSFLGMPSHILIFVPQLSGKYLIIAYDTSGLEIAKYSFEVLSPLSIKETNVEQSLTPTSPIMDNLRETINLDNLNNENKTNSSSISLNKSKINSLSSISHPPSKKEFRLKDAKGSMELPTEFKFSKNNIEIISPDENSSNSTVDAELLIEKKSIKKIKLKNVNLKNTYSLDLGLEDLASASTGLEDVQPVKVVQAYAIDPTAVDFTDGEFSSVAQGKTLWKCKDWNFTKQICFGSWIEVMSLTPGLEYNVTITPADPAYAETFNLNPAVDIDSTALDNTTLVIAWVDGNNYRTSFEIWNVNGTLLVDQTDADVDGNNESRVAVKAINTTHFALAYADGPLDDLAYYIYDKGGNIRFSKVTSDTNIGNYNDVDICELGTNFAIINSNSADGDADFRIYKNNGTENVAESNVDGTLTPDSYYNNYVSCSALNGTHWVYAWFDDASNVASYAIRNNATVGTTNLYTGSVDTAVGEQAQVAVASIRNNTFGIVYYDFTSQNISFTVRKYNTTQFIISTQTIDTNASINSSVDIAEILFGQRSMFVVGWGDRADNSLKVGVYNESGGVITAPFNVTDNFNTSVYKMLSLEGANSRLNFGLCNGTFSVAYTNKSKVSSFKTYWYNGTLWNGICPDTSPPIITLNEPANYSFYYSNTNIQLNFTATDNQDETIQNCTLFGNFSGAWLENISLFNVVSAEKSTFYINLTTDQGYKWNVRCTDSWTLIDSSSTNFSFRLNAQPPNITSPQINISKVNQSYYVRFNVSIADYYNISLALVELLYPNETKQNYTLNRTNNQFYLLFNNTLQLGVYNFTAIWANDTGNLPNIIFTDLSFEVTSSPPSEFNLSSPANSTISTNLVPTLVWNKTIEEKFSNYTILITTDESFSSIDFVYSTNNVTNTSRLLDYALNANTIYFWKVIAYDIFGNSRNSTSYFKYTTDNLGPSVTLIYPQNFSFITAYPTHLTFIPNEVNNLGACTLWGNFSGTFRGNFTLLFPNNTIENNISLYAGEGIYTWNVLCNDTLGNKAFSPENFSFIVDLTGPNITLLNPQNNHTENNSNILRFTVNASDIANVSFCNLMIDNVTESTIGTIDNGVPFNFTKFLLNGNYTWYVNCTDKNNLFSFTSIRNLTVRVIDTNAPLITINSPSNEQYIPNSSVLFNFTAEDATGLTNCSIYIDSKLNLTNSSTKNFVDNSFIVNGLSNGKHNWSISCYDNSTEFNRRNTSYLNFTIDTILPTIELNKPSLFSFQFSYVLFNYTPSDTNLEQCALYTNYSGLWQQDDINLTPNNNGPNLIPLLFFDGTYYWNILCNDSAGNYGWSSTNITFFVDTSPPYYSNIKEVPINSSYYLPNAIYSFNSTWGDTYIINTVLFENNFNGNLTNNTPTNYSSEYSIVIPDLPAGTYIYRWFSNDSVGNFNATDIYVYEILRSLTLLNLTLNSSNENLTINQTQSVNITAILLNPQDGILSIYVNSSHIASGQSPLQAITPFNLPGIYNITVIYNETQNYTYKEAQLTLTVDDIFSPTVSLEIPLNNSQIAAGLLSLQYNVTDDSPILNCSLFINEVLELTNTTITKGTTQYFLIYLAEGNYSWSVGCFDTHDNYGQSPIQNFTAIFSNYTISTIYLTNTTYQKGEPAIINLQTTDLFNNSIDTFSITDVIRGNTTTNWWNSSWIYRTQLLFSLNSSGIRDYTIELNWTNITGFMQNCTELRVVKWNGLNNILIDSYLTRTSNVSCILQFNANIPPNSINYSGYYLYYGNSLAENISTAISLSGIKVQKGSTSGTAASLTGNIEAVNQNKAFLLFTSYVGSSLPNNWQLTGYLSTDTQAVFDRYAGTTTAFIDYQVIEDSFINVQSGSLTYTTTDTNLSANINNVNLSNSFIIISGRVNSGTNSISPQGMFGAEFVNSSRIKISRGTPGTAAFVRYQVVEWNKTNVQSGTALITGTDTNITLNAINLSRSFIVAFPTLSGSTTAGAAFTQAILTNATNLQLIRQIVAGTLNVSYFVVELPLGYTIQNGTVTAPAADTYAKLSPILVNRTFHIESWSSSTNANTYTNAQMKINITNSTDLIFDKGTATGTLISTWYVVSLISPTYTINQQNKLIMQNQNQTGSLGSLYMNWSTFNSTLGVYSIAARSSKENFSDSFAYKTFNVIPDTTNPLVNLISPPDLDKWGVGNINFTYTVFDYNLKNCSFWTDKKTGLGFIPNATNTSPINYINNSFNYIYLGIGLHPWNVLCFDTEGNKAFASYNYTINITGPDLYISNSRIWINYTSLVENENATLFANLTNIGLSDAVNSFKVQFFKGDPDLNGVQIGSNLTVQNLSVNGFIILNTSYLIQAGINDIFVKIDPDNTVNESNFENNKASLNFTISLYQIYFGNSTLSLILGSNESGSLLSFVGQNPVSGHILISDSDSNFILSNLKALTRNKLDSSTNNDFTEADSSLGILGYNDSVKSLWGGKTDSPLQVSSFNLSFGTINNVPIINSTNSSNFVTGILWDTSDDVSINLQYDLTDKEDLVFITRFNKQKSGRYGIYDYEIKVPALLRNYRPSQNSLAIYVELI